MKSFRYKLATLRSINGFVDFTVLTTIVLETGTYNMGPPVPASALYKQKLTGN